MRSRARRSGCGAGEAYADVAYDAWAAGEIARLAELRLAAEELRIEAELELGGHAHAVAELEPLIRAAPLQERLRGLLVLALYRAGRQADALEAYQDCRRALVDGLGLDRVPSCRRSSARSCSSLWSSWPRRRSC